MNNTTAFLETLNKAATLANELHDHLVKFARAEGFDDLDEAMEEIGDGEVLPAENQLLALLDEVVSAGAVSPGAQREAWAWLEGAIGDAVGYWAERWNVNDSIARVATEWWPEVSQERAA